MSIRRRDLIKYFEENGFYLLREGRKHSIYTNDEKTVPIKRHRTLVSILAFQAGQRLLELESYRVRFHKNQR